MALSCHLAQDECLVLLFVFQVTPVRKGKDPSFASYCLSTHQCAVQCINEAQFVFIEYIDKLKTTMQIVSILGQEMLFILGKIGEKCHLFLAVGCI